MDVDERPSVEISVDDETPQNEDRDSDISLSCSDVPSPSHSNDLLFDLKTLVPPKPRFSQPAEDQRGIPYSTDNRKTVHRKSKRVECSLCSKRFNTQANLDKHFTTAHLKEEPTWETSWPMLPSENNHAGDPNVDDLHGRRNRKRFACSDCNKKFTRVQRLRVHLNVCHGGGEPPFACFDCNRRFCDSSTQKRHMAIVHSRADQRPIFPCKVCGKEFVRRTNLNAHIRRHWGGVSYRCSHCGETFKKQGDYIAHSQQNHAAERPYECGQCGQRFFLLHMLRQHEEKHVEKDTRYRPYCCYECSKTFASASSLRAHLQRHSALSASSHCVICDQSFTHRRNLSKHVRSHLGEKPQRPQCPTCGLRTYGLSRHMLTHSSVKPFVCSCCKKSFSQLWYLETHMRLHTGERPYACEDCGMTFHTGRYLKTHRQRVHLFVPKLSAEVTYVKCPNCPKEFSTANPYSLKRHVMAVHENFRPHACDRCGRTFAQFVNLESHMRLHTGERPYECGACGKQFAQLSNMKLHVRRQHQQDAFN